MEPINSDRRPTVRGAGVPVLPSEVVRTLYQPQPRDWGGDRDSECDRISSELNKIMNLDIAVPFSSPVDLKLHPSYASVVEYPMDLSTIKARLDNRFYRRVKAVEFDANYIYTNAYKFYQAKSDIVRSALIIKDLCLAIIRNRNAANAIAVETDENASGAGSKRNKTTQNIRSISHYSQHTESKVNCYKSTFLKLFSSVNYFRKGKLSLGWLQRWVSAGRNTVKICWRF